MNFSGDDIHRSVRRYVSLVLSEPWKVRTEKQPVTDDDRPVCVVEPSAPVTTGKMHRITIPQGDIEKLTAFSVMAYPAVGATARESRLAAQQVADRLDAAFSLGVVVGEGEDARNVGGPFRVPVYDYEGVPVTGPDRATAADPSAPYGYLRLDDLTVRALQDPLDYLRFSVACDLRVSWEQGGRLGPTAPIAREMAGSFVVP